MDNVEKVKMLTPDIMAAEGTVDGARALWIASVGQLCGSPVAVIYGSAAKGNRPNCCNSQGGTVGADSYSSSGSLSKPEM